MVIVAAESFPCAYLRVKIWVSFVDAVEFSFDRVSDVLLSSLLHQITTTTTTTDPLMCNACLFGVLMCVRARRFAMHVSE